MTNPIQQLKALGQSIWYDNIRRGMLESGEMQRLIDIGVSGLTSNPTIFEKAITGSGDYDDALLELALAGKTTEEIYEALTLEDIRAAADLLRPVYDSTGGADGYASLEVDPHLAHDTDATVAEAKRLFQVLGRPNVMIKVPATPEGIPAVRRLIGQGVNVNVTLTFSLEAYEQVREAYIAGLEDLQRAGGDVSRIASVASFFVSRVDTAVDALLQERVKQGETELAGLMGKAAIANARLAYHAFRQSFDGQRFAGLRAAGARVQRPLWASTSTKNPAYSDVLYVESLIGRDTVNTLPDVTLQAFLDHGRVDEALGRGLEDARLTIDALEQAGVSMKEVTDRLLADGVKAFADSFDKLMANLAQKRSLLLARALGHSRASLGDHADAVQKAADDLRRQDVVARIWRRDHTVWKPDPREIADRLGWLTVTDQMRSQVAPLKALGEEAREAGYRHVVLLGMGGSSLGPEVLRQTFGSVPGYPQMIVLDSVVPEWVSAVTSAVDPARALFLFASKSGTTVEPNALYKYFRDIVERAVGPHEAGRRFMVITDPGTPLERLGREQGFRRVFLNPPDIGGRYSVLSLFGLVPAALMGVDVQALLDRADLMRDACAPAAPADQSPGAWLGAVMASLAQEGRDKLTIVTSPGIASFGLWLEQLIAESTGKDGKGIVPVAGEPLAPPGAYGDDRAFVYLRLQGDDNEVTDRATSELEASGQPVVRLELRDRYDLGAEFYRWEFATAVAGAILGIHPFDQPDVQATKEQTDRVLSEYQRSHRLPEVRASQSLRQLLDSARPGDYLAIMAYVRPTPEVEGAFADLRRRVMERHRIATTLGYGPRFLHSTGQLHKGGRDNGLFLQIVAQHPDQVPIPGEGYTFNVLADAQALGDLRALQALGRRVARVRLGRDVAVGVKALVSQVD